MITGMKEKKKKRTRQKKDLEGRINDNWMKEKKKENKIKERFGMKN